jgi:HAMP domain-containing protein
MWELLKEVAFVIALIAALFASAWFTEPTERYLRTGQTCHEIRQRMATKRYRDLTPAEETDLANCN